MKTTDTSIDKLNACISEIDQILKSEFPFLSSQRALRAIRNCFTDKRDELISAIENKNDPDIIEELCAQITVNLVTYLPFLGFLRNSTNTRIAFEITNPLKEIAEKSLKNIEKIQLIISSEWIYSPFIRKPAPIIPNYLLIGLPAHESSNPLVLPVAGHEIGHPVWRANACEKSYRAEMSGVISGWMREESVALGIFRDLNIPRVDFENAQNNMFVSTEIKKYINGIIENALAQCEELFSDFFGICIFGESFIYSLSYLFSPYIPAHRSPKYPTLNDRITYDIKFHRKIFKTSDVDLDHLMRENSEERKTASKPFSLVLIDRVVAHFIDRLMNDASSAFAKSKLPYPTREERDRIFKRFSFIVPCEDVISIGDIINAGWKAYCLSDKWGEELPDNLDKKRSALKDLLLKTIEVFHLKKEQKNASKS